MLLKKLTLIAIIFLLIGLIAGALAFMGIIVAVPITSKLMFLIALLCVLLSIGLIVVEKYVLKGKDIKVSKN